MSRVGYPVNVDVSPNTGSQLKPKRARLVAALARYSGVGNLSLVAALEDVIERLFSLQCFGGQVINFACGEG